MNDVSEKGKDNSTKTSIANTMEAGERTVAVDEASYAAAKELAESYADLLKQKEEYESRLGAYPHYTLSDVYYLLTQGSHEQSERVQTSGISDPVAKAVINAEKVRDRLNREMDDEFRKEVVEPYLDVCEKTALFEICMNELDRPQRDLADQLYIQRRARSSIVDLQGNYLPRRKLERETDALLRKLAWILSKYKQYRKSGGEKLKTEKG